MLDFVKSNQFKLPQVKNMNHEKLKRVESNQVMPSQV